jgi:hypothetical protein
MRPVRALLPYHLGGLPAAAELQQSTPELTVSIATSKQRLLSEEKQIHLRPVCLSDFGKVFAQVVTFSKIVNLTTEPFPLTISAEEAYRELLQPPAYE